MVYYVTLTSNTSFSHYSAVVVAVAAEGWIDADVGVTATVDTAHSSS